MNAHTPLRRRDRGAHHEPAPSIKPASEDHRGQRRSRTKTAPEAAGAATPRAGSIWNSERIAQLRSCAGAGLTCSQIAAEIGVSRNAVIGKLHRLGLSRGRSAPASEPALQRAALRAKRDNVTRLFSQHRILMRLPPEPPAPPETIRNGNGCSLLELGPGKCRWPINEPGAADFCFCAHQQVEGLPYCVGHARVAYKTAARSSWARLRPA